MRVRTVQMLVLAPIVLMACQNEYNTSVINVGPVVRIDRPSDGAVFEGLQTVELEALVQDDNGLDDLVSVIWHSDVEGELGTPDLVLPDTQGLSFLATNLTTGIHTLTFTATDAGGLSASDSVTIAVGGLDSLPVAQILSPEDFDEFDYLDDVDLVGIVSDTDDVPASLTVTWTYQNTAGGPEVVLYTGPPASNGTTVAEIEDAPAGTFQIALTVEDAAGNIVSDDVFISVIDPFDLDGDGDGFTVNGGDCNDGDPTVYPGAPEYCDAKDNDCNLVIDDKDADHDLHVDMVCTLYTGAMPKNDCDDADISVYGGAPEIIDGRDNDCDGGIDEGGGTFDDDGDCYCEGPQPCVDSVNNSCVSIVTGDCNDADDDINPLAYDDPDPTYFDDDCDGIDGDEERAVFVATSGVNGTGSRCSRTTPCRTIAFAVGRAQALGLSQVFLRQGQYNEIVEPPSNFEFYGGYSSSWVRGPVFQSLYEVKIVGAKHADGQYATVRARNVSGVYFEGLHIIGPDASERVGLDGKSTYAVHASGAGLLIERAKITGGSGADGAEGTWGSHWNQSQFPDAGNTGENAYRLGWASCSEDTQGGGAGGTSGCSATYGDVRGGNGGYGGRADTRCDGWPWEWNWNDQAGGGGAGAYVISGSAGVGGSAGQPCQGPTGGQPGRVVNGGGGVAGTYPGRLSSDYWYSGPGGTGGLGFNGGGGGGGGGSGGCDNGDTNSDSVGAGGGGGGAGGCRNESAGGGGGGGGGSFGVFASSASSVTVRDTVFQLGSGGVGGRGGVGGAGQRGGLGGSGGGGDSGAQPGGRGGDGGHGGHAGGGGGGAGGSVYGIYAYSSTVLPQGNTFNGGAVGLGGSGGSSAAGTTWSDGIPGSTGQNGEKVSVDSCAFWWGC